MGNLKKSKKLITVKQLLNLIEKVSVKETCVVVLHGDGSGFLVPYNDFMNLKIHEYKNFTEIKGLMKELKEI